MPSESSIKQYERVIRTLEKRGLTDLKDVEKVLRTIRTKIDGEPATKATIAQQLSAIMWKVGDKAPEWKRYREEMISANEENAKSKTYTKTEKSMDWKDLKDKYKYKEGSAELVLALFALNPPRRIQDYAVMKLVEKEPSDTEVNYLVDNDDKPYFIFNKYKTARHYGQQRLFLTGEMLKFYRNRIAYHMEWDTFLFPVKEGGRHIEPKNLTRIMKRESGATANTFRHAYITEFLKGNPTTDQRKKVAEMMGHNISTQLEYDERDEDDEL